MFGDNVLKLMEIGYSVSDIYIYSNSKCIQYNMYNTVMVNKCNRGNKGYHELSILNKIALK